MVLWNANGAVHLLLLLEIILSPIPPCTVVVMLVALILLYVFVISCVTVLISSTSSWKSCGHRRLVKRLVIVRPCVLTIEDGPLQCAVD